MHISIQDFLTVNDLNIIRKNDIVFISTNKNTVERPCIIINENLNGSVKDFDLFIQDQLEFRVEKVIPPSEDNQSESYRTKALTEGQLNDKILLTHKPKVFQLHVITLSDRAYNKIYEDRSGPYIIQALEKYFNSLGKRFQIHYHLIPDDPNQLSNLINDNYFESDLIITSGGTGIGPKDFTVDIVQDMLDIEIPGIMELIRVKYGQINPNAALSRGIAGVKNNCMLFTLPGSLKAAKEYMQEIESVLDHLYYMRYGIDKH